MIDHWHREARLMIKAQLARHGVSYRELVTRLAALGVRETERSITNKLSRGTFRFTFVLQVMNALGEPALTLRPRQPPPGDESSPKP